MKTKITSFVHFVPKIFSKYLTFLSFYKLFQMDQKMNSFVLSHFLQRNFLILTYLPYTFYREEKIEVGLNKYHSNQCTVSWKNKKTQLFLLSDILSIFCQNFCKPCLTNPMSKSDVRQLFPSLLLHHITNYYITNFVRSLSRPYLVCLATWSVS